MKFFDAFTDYSSKNLLIAYGNIFVIICSAIWSIYVSASHWMYKQICQLFMSGQRSEGVFKAKNLLLSKRLPC